MKNLIIILSAFACVISCKPEPRNRRLKYQNIVILSDMSSRLNNLPQKDTQEIFKLVDFFKNECVKPGEKIGDKSSIYFSTFSDKEAASIDLNRFKNLGDKQKFINSREKYRGKGLDQSIKDFKEIIKNKYDSIRNPGLDLISILIEKIDFHPLIKESSFIVNGVDTTFIDYENHFFVFTDGYLEYLNKNVNSQFYFGKSEIDNLRKFCISNKTNINTALDKEKSMSLPAFDLKQSKNIHLHILETQERDKDIVQGRYSNPLGLRDNEILEAVWRRWASESGFKSFEWKKY